MSQATDGSLKVTVVDGLSYVGNTKLDGSLTVFQTDGSEWTGRKHVSGATNVVVEPSGEFGVNHPSGAMNVTTDPYVSGMQRVTVVSGTLTEP